MTEGKVLCPLPPAVAEHQRVKREAAGVAESEARLVDAPPRDPSPEGHGSAALCRRFSMPAKADLKALLAAAPLDGIDLDRDREFSRELDF